MTSRLLSIAVACLGLGIVACLGQSTQSLSAADLNTQATMPAAADNAPAKSPAAATTTMPSATATNPAATQIAADVTPTAKPVVADDAMAAARAYVAQHGDRYMDHRRLTRGMKGYGLTVMAGTEIVRFDVEIVSVLINFGPRQDVVLARLSGQGLEKSGVIAGMSGSPCFVTDPVDGKEKMIGAVAYGWSFPKEPLCGLQPITQMIASSGLFDKPSSRLAATEPAVASGAAGSSNETAGVVPQATKEFLQTVLSSRKLDFATFAATGTAAQAKARAAAGPAGLVPLSTPLAISANLGGTSDRMDALAKSMQLMPVSGGSAGSADVKAAKDLKLEPGSSLGIMLVSGDTDASGVGTVTEVIGDRVLGFGHALFGEGDVDVPMGTAYVHSVIPGVMESFKLASPLTVLGSLRSDQRVGVTGILGEKAPTIPVAVNVLWKDSNRRQNFKFQIIRHSRLTHLALLYCIRNAAMGWKDLPEHHTVSHKVSIDFGKLGTYKACNISADDDIFSAASDAGRAVAAMMRNPFGPPVVPLSIQIDLEISPTPLLAEVLSLKLDGTIYRPGETVTGKAMLRPFRGKDFELPVSLKLPAEMSEGSYRLSVCDAEHSMDELHRHMPHRFAPRTVEELFAAVQMVVDRPCDQMFLSLPLRAGGLALGQKELPELPASKARILSEAGLLNTSTFSDTILSGVSVGYVVNGQAVANFTVQVRPQETLLRP